MKIKISSNNTKFPWKFLTVLLVFVALVTIVVLIIPAISAEIKIISIIVSLLVVVNIFIAFRFHIPLST